MDDKVKTGGNDGRGSEASTGSDTADLSRGGSDNEAIIMKGHVSKDRVHLFISIPQQVTISRLLQKMKGKTAYKLMGEFPHLKKKLWGGHMWARGCFCCSSGDVTDEIVKQYIESAGRDKMFCLSQALHH